MAKKKVKGYVALQMTEDVLTDANVSVNHINLNTEEVLGAIIVFRKKKYAKKYAGENEIIEIWIG